ncbi:hypothetical protein ASG87_01415 [Frateuria sp. Soil773]|nr:hypothetical protein ASG87_01415 [Frateuria sp. Soil773]
MVQLIVGCVSGFQFKVHPDFFMPTCEHVSRADEQVWIHGVHARGQFCGLIGHLIVVVEKGLVLANQHAHERGRFVIDRLSVGVMEDRGLLPMFFSKAARPSR